MPSPNVIAGALIEHGELLGNAAGGLYSAGMPITAIRQRLVRWEGAGDDIGRRHQAVGGLVMFVDTDAVKAEFVGVGQGIDVALVEAWPLTGS